jgi:hypothetical protein
MGQHYRLPIYCISAYVETNVLFPVVIACLSIKECNILNCSRLNLRIYRDFYTGTDFLNK